MAVGGRSHHPAGMKPTLDEAKAAGPAVAGRGGESPARAGLVNECAEEDSNLHGVIPHKALNLARLPIPPPALAGAQNCSAARLFASVQASRYGVEHMFGLTPFPARV